MEKGNEDESGQGKAAHLQKIYDEVATTKVAAAADSAVVNSVVHTCTDARRDVMPAEILPKNG